MTFDRLQLGQDGEEAAAAWYEEQGWHILDRNWRSGRGELDIVAYRDGVLVVCEVKARTRADHFAPADAVNWKKQNQIRKLTHQWLAQAKSYYPKIRFDVAEVVVTSGHLDVNVLENAF